MKLRIVCREDDEGAIQVGGSVKTEWRTFEIEASPEFERWITGPDGQPDRRGMRWTHRWVSGLEIVTAEAQAAKGEGS